MPKILKVTVEIEVDDLEPDEMDEPGHAELADYNAAEVAEVLESIDEHTSAELFGGSSIYLQFNSCKVLSAEWRSQE